MWCVQIWLISNPIKLYLFIFAIPRKIKFITSSYAQQALTEQLNEYRHHYLFLVISFKEGGTQVRPSVIYVHKKATWACICGGVNFDNLYACMCVCLRNSWWSPLSCNKWRHRSHLGRRTPLCHSGWHMERQPPARGVQKRSLPCHCLSLRLCPLLCPHAGRLWERERETGGGVGASWTGMDWQVTGESGQTASETDTQTFIH